MKTSNASRKLALVAGLLSAGMLSQAYAGGTIAGTTVSNTASITGYTVGGVQQLNSGATINSNQVNFLVDRRINLTVAQSGGAVLVAPGATNRVQTFTVTNTSNSILDFALTAANLTGDQFDVSSIVGIYAESGATPGYQAGEDTTLITYLDEVPVDASRTVYVVANIPAVASSGPPVVPLVSNDEARISLKADARLNIDAGGAYVVSSGALGAAAVQTTTANTANIDTVFADLAGTASGDVARDASHSDTGIYRIATAALTVTKTSVVVWDPFNGTTNPKAIPGAVVQYCLVVANAGVADASSVTLTDAIPLNTAYYSTTATGAAGAPTPGVTIGTGATCGSSVNASIGTAGTVATPAPRGSVTVSYPTITAAASPSTPTNVWAAFYVTVQ